MIQKLHLFPLKKKINKFPIKTLMDIRDFVFELNPPKTTVTIYLHSWLFIFPNKVYALYYYTIVFTLVFIIFVNFSFLFKKKVNLMSNFKHFNGYNNKIGSNRKWWIEVFARFRDVIFEYDITSLNDMIAQKAKFEYSSFFS